MRVPIMAGNWKMNTSVGEAVNLACGIRDGSGGISNVDIIVFPPTIWLGKVSEILGNSNVMVGAQNMHHEAGGAFTGEISPAMVKEFASHVILGHSERRWVFGETDAVINMKVRAALENGLIPILAVGERLEEREGGLTGDVISRQLRRGLNGIPATGDIVVAYEPLWAIGTGRAATPDIANETIALARDTLDDLYGAAFAERIRILYGGSVSTKNVADLVAMPEVDGGLVGAACLEAGSFLALARQAGEGLV